MTYFMEEASVAEVYTAIDAAVASVTTPSRSEHGEEDEPMVGHVEEVE